jgi:hypothetical protein
MGDFVRDGRCIRLIEPETGKVIPHGTFVASTIETNTPARQRLAGILFAKGLEDDGARQQRGHKVARQTAGEQKFLRAQGGNVPFGQSRILRNERWFTALRNDKIVRCKYCIRTLTKLRDAAHARL